MCPAFLAGVVGDALAHAPVGACCVKLKDLKQYSLKNFGLNAYQLTQKEPDPDPIPNRSDPYLLTQQTDSPPAAAREAPSPNQLQSFIHALNPVPTGRSELAPELCDVKFGAHFNLQTVSYHPLSPAQSWKIPRWVVTTVGLFLDPLPRSRWRFAWCCFVIRRPHRRYRSRRPPSPRRLPRQPNPAPARQRTRDPATWRVARPRRVSKTRLTVISLSGRPCDIPARPHPHRSVIASSWCRVILASSVVRATVRSAWPPRANRPRQRRAKRKPPAGHRKMPWTNCSANPLFEPREGTPTSCPKADSAAKRFRHVPATLNRARARPVRVGNGPPLPRFARRWSPRCTTHSPEVGSCGRSFGWHS